MKMRRIAEDPTKAYRPLKNAMITCLPSAKTSAVASDNYHPNKDRKTLNAQSHRQNFQPVFGFGTNSIYRPASQLPNLKIAFS